MTPPGKMSTTIIYQSEYWQNIHGERIAINTIDARYAENIIIMLIRKLSRLNMARSWHWCQTEEWGNNEEPDLTPETLLDTPLLVALRKRLDVGHPWYLEDMSWLDEVERAYMACWDEGHEIRAFIDAHNEQLADYLCSRFN